MSVDMRVRGCSECGKHPYECECYGTECEWCNMRDLTTEKTEWGHYCEDCRDKIIEPCDACECDIFKPDSYVVTKIDGDKKTHRYFCDDECAANKAEWDFIREWT